MADNDNAARTARSQSGDRSIDFAERLLVGCIIAAMKRPRHFRHHDQCTLVLQSADDSTVEPARPASFAVQINDPQVMQISHRLSCGNLRREQKTERYNGGGGKRNGAAAIHAPNIVSVE